MTEKEFMNCAEGNDDGIGFGFNKGGKQAFIKGFMDGEQAYEFYKQFPKKPHIAHFRLSTAGSVTPKLTHPFICSDTSNLLLNYVGDSPILFHNGMLFSWETYAKKYDIKINEFMSDTRMLAMLISKLGMKEALDLFSGSKFIILKDGTAYMRGDFIYENGVYFSNTGYKYSYGRFYKKNKTTVVKKTSTTNNATVVKQESYVPSVKNYKY
jgi:predicted glutamine amidotransferase